MKRHLITAIALGALCGTAAATEPPYYVGDYGSAVENALRATSETPSAPLTIDRMATASIDQDRLPTTSDQDIRSGR